MFWETYRKTESQASQKVRKDRYEKTEGLLCSGCKTGLIVIKKKRVEPVSRTELSDVHAAGFCFSAGNERSDFVVVIAYGHASLGKKDWTLEN